MIDGRDLAAFALDLLEREVDGTFDVVSPAGMLTFAGLIDACLEASGSAARIVWVDERFLLDRGVEPWTELPLWTPGEDMAGFQRSDVSRALAAGLVVRPIADTVADDAAVGGRRRTRTGPGDDAASAKRSSWPSGTRPADSSRILVGNPHRPLM